MMFFAFLSCGLQGKEKAPWVEILTPQQGATFSEAEEILFSALVGDDRGPAELVLSWESSLDGSFGGGTTATGKL